MADEGGAGAGTPGGRGLCCRPAAEAQRCAGAAGGGVGEGLHEGLDAVRDGIEKLREDEARRWESLERRLARREAPRESTGSADVLGVAARGPEKTPAATRPAETCVPKRLYPELVTKEPAPDDEEVYGEAWPLIEEWRRLWKTHSAGGRGLAWLEVEERASGSWRWPCWNGTG